MHIAIAGNIGVGKTTLAHLLARQFGWQVYEEAVEDNPYLADFYADMPRWAFHLQVFFLNSRFRQVLSINQISQSQTVVQDRTIFEDARIFARNLHSSGLLSDRDYDNYLQLFGSMIALVRPPDLLIYLKADLPQLMDRIARRGRSYENNLSVGYLRSLNGHYESWIADYQEGPLLVLDVNGLDYENNPEHRQRVFAQIAEKLPAIPTEK